jgi:DMSO/TMAO reductase YedYZ heme-binding membrane subunit
MSSQLYWFIARSSGIVAWALLTTSVLWGLLLSTKVFGRRPRPNWLLDLHRFLGGTAAIFVAVHVLALVADSYVHFGPSEILVPLASTYRPLAVAWGVVGLYLLAAVELTSLARKHLPKRVWHGIHMASFPLFALATIHALTAGTDSTNLLLRLGIVVPTIAVAALAAIRTSDSACGSGARATDPHAETGHPARVAASGTPPR